MAIASNGALIETNAEEIEAQALEALERSVAALSNEMKALRRATDRFDARMSSQAEQIGSTCTKLRSSMAELRSSIHRLEQDTIRSVNPSTSSPISISTFANCSQNILTSSNASVQSSDATIASSVSTSTQNRHSCIDRLLLSTANSSSFSTPPEHPRFPYLVSFFSPSIEAFDSQSAKPHTATSLPNSLNPHSFVPERLGENLRPLDGDLEDEGGQILVPLTESDSNEEELPTPSSFTTLTFEILPHTAQPQSGLPPALTNVQIFTSIPFHSAPESSAITSPTHRSSTSRTLPQLSERINLAPLHSVPESSANTSRTHLSSTSRTVLQLSEYTNLVPFPVNRTDRTGCSHFYSLPVRISCLVIDVDGLVQTMAQLASIAAPLTLQFLTDRLSDKKTIPPLRDKTADGINLPGMLMKGSLYTGTDDGEEHLNKMDNGSESIIDLRSVPGTLIPAAVTSKLLLDSALGAGGFSGSSGSTNKLRVGLHKVTRAQEVASNAASCGMKIVFVGTDVKGNINMEDARRANESNQDTLSALRVTYPSTHGILEEGTDEICEVTHGSGSELTTFQLVKPLILTTWGHYFLRIQKTRIEARSVRVVMIYNMGLTLSCQSKQGHSTGEITNFKSIDAQREATPKTNMRTMGVKGLTLYHLKSHLQKYGLGKQSCKEGNDISKDASGVAESQDADSSTLTSSGMIAQDLNEGYQVTEALRVQMEVQRRLHEQVEVRRHLQLRVEAQGKYLQSIIEKACKALNDQATAFAGLEAAREELSELAIRVSNDCNGLVLPVADTHKMPNANTSTLPARIGDCSVDSCLTSIGSPVSPNPVCAGSQGATMKKRPRPFLGNGDLMPSESNMQYEVGWMMTTTM